MGKKKQLLIPVCILFLLCIPSQVRADYFENHVDRGDYCMQAKDIRITDAQRKNWMHAGTLQEKLLELSGVFVNQFHPSDSTQYWTEYDGSIEVDMQALEGLQMQDGNPSKTVPVVFYIEGNEDVSITIHVEVTASEQQSTNSTGESDVSENIPRKNKEQNGTSGTDRTRTGFWLFITIVSVMGYGYSLHSDFKVLRKYKRLKESEGTQ
ncbi:hypothetical protein [Hespellia stercorisuis]|uniref:Uncharacterized protein n=1 Tax=Hespellia stercorisuis DSM 15480 TaxID=1121950 RepID=A0A1M6W0B5_9FIRM|nr:hypothetical protein [Hespellia stercorisuis]SHK87134.1 hypothetical protein SAMN02745243_03902 [Hespellia stercorisuis DSM 15480]